MVAIDHLSYPHIVDRILDFCDIKANLAFSATCSQYRRAVDHAEIGITPNGVLSAITADRGITFPWPLSMIKVIDLDGRSGGIATQRSLTKAQRDQFQRVKIIRRAEPTATFYPASRNHVRLPDVDTVVDYIDLDNCGTWGDRRFDLLSCLNRHILHITWTDGPNTPVSFGYDPSLHLARSTLELVVVLWPERADAEGTTSGVVEFIRRLYCTLDQEITIVTPTYGSLTLDFDRSRKHMSFKSYDEWRTGLGGYRNVLSEWM
ncbi:uncharacterized protein LOC62_04G005293 [Vanrija pseudolonga]|uniref:F-box domain-containing protein n=1 Tax=Vanrija pseudolonga TaxID=143232 RepID=A0AAF0Y8A9_9TREE|nr:hypothetical protein LOC62_04G005293 [Vanrija pseudolonga]